jgi:hypothetical protein
MKADEATTGGSRAPSASGPASRSTADERALYAEIRYLSRLNSEWECWAVFDHVAITADLPTDTRQRRRAERIAKLYGLRVC